MGSLLNSDSGNSRTAPISEQPAPTDGVPPLCRSVTDNSKVRKMTKLTLARLYEAQSSAKKADSKSAGYPVFSNFGMKIYVAGGDSGNGIVLDKKKKNETFMKMIEVQAGLV